MKRCLCLAAALLLSVGTAWAVSQELPRDLRDAAPQEAEVYLRGSAFAPGDLSAGVNRILEGASRQLSGVVRQRVRGAAAVVLAVFLCSAVRGADETPAVPLAGALAVTALSAGSSDFPNAQSDGSVSADQYDFVIISQSVKKSLIVSL